MIVTVAHLRFAGLCEIKARIWFVRNGLDFDEFLRAGLPIEQFEATDSLGALIAKTAREETDGGY